MAYGDFKYFTIRTTSDKILCYKALLLYKIENMTVYKFFDKKSALLADKSASSEVIKNENISNKELAE